VKTLAILLIALAAALPARAEVAVPAKPVPRLVGTVMIKGDIVRLGDIFENTGAKADTAIAYAPAPGHRATLDADWLAETARRNDLAWRPQSPSDHVMVERASQKIGADAILAQLNTALRDYSGDAEMKIDLDDRAAEIYVGIDAAPTLAIRNLRINEVTGRFTASVLAPADRPTAELAISGRAVRVTEVPVLAHRIGRGDVINQADLAMAKVPVSQVGRDTLTDAKDIIGLEPTRPLMPGTPIRSQDVRAPVLVPKNSLVTIVLRRAGMELTVQGKALDEGSRGDTVRVMNTKSQRLLEAQVDGPGIVVLTPSRAAAIN
jgi:flagella basal body P-ring formation protein FlgA